jgi:hypothetical protein
MGETKACCRTVRKIAQCLADEINQRPQSPGNRTKRSSRQAGSWRESNADLVLQHALRAVPQWLGILVALSSCRLAARLWEQLNAFVTDWTQVVDAHGAVGRVPLLLDQVEREEVPEAWEELWDRLCLHGETVSAASFAALPRLAALAPTYAQALELASAIVRGTLRHPDGEALLVGCPNEVARLRELVDQRLRTRPADYNRLFGDLLALAGQYHWSASMGDFADDFYAVSCPGCEAEVTIAVGDYGCYAAIRDWDRGDDRAADAAARSGRGASRPGPMDARHSRPGRAAAARRGDQIRLWPCRVPGLRQCVQHCGSAHDREPSSMSAYA